MARTLILDPEALSALARPRERSALALRARAILAVAHEEHALVRVPAPVLAEVCRGGARDAPIDHILSNRGIIVAPLTANIARRAGAILARAKLSGRSATTKVTTNAQPVWGRRHSCNDSNCDRIK